jgi:hypothetical protein
MLTKAKHKQGEGNLNTFDPEVGCASQRKKMEEEDGRTNVWILREEDEEEREDKGNTCK